ncbi:hypothetical protein V6N11_082467 [Hibiscus sabdariffa]|uniref:DUF4218 domain-containing protein n=1 Tax=Hibiscus sabdariffa TaxID=183260 RepID=A0ABR2PD13_9ROSI
MIIPGEKRPWNDIDIYLQPFIEELKQLWVGVKTFDMLKKENFTLRAALLWTINDFPTDANLSGWSTKGRYACPCCAAQTCSRWLYNGKKLCYMGHRPWLDENHSFRYEHNLFDGTEEFRAAPEQTTGSEIFSMLKQMKFSEEDDPTEAELWKKRSIFFRLPYWKHNILRHNLDVMHIEKKFDIGIQHALHPQVLPTGKSFLTPAIFTMSKKEKEVFCNVLKDIKVLDGYASNISRCVSVKDRRLYSLKSHDYHILMQDLLLVALRSCMSSEVTSCIIELSNIMKSICGKVLMVEELEKLQDRVALTLCNLKKIFPPSFFTIMVHLLVHLPEEAKVGGPVFYRWMYPIERYLEDVDTRYDRPTRNEVFISNDLTKTYLFGSYGEPVGSVEIAELDDISWVQAHRYVLFHHDSLDLLRT